MPIFVQSPSWSHLLTVHHMLLTSELRYLCVNVCVFTRVCVFTHVCVGTHGCQKRVSDPMEMYLQAVVNCPDVDTGKKT